MTVSYRKYKDGKRQRNLNITFEKKKKHKTEGSSKVSNMDTICYSADEKDRKMKIILKLLT